MGPTRHKLVHTGNTELTTYRRIFTTQGILQRFLGAKHHHQKTQMIAKILMVQPTQESVPVTPPQLCLCVYFE